MRDTEGHTPSTALHQSGHCLQALISQGPIRALSAVLACYFGLLDDLLRIDRMVAFNLSYNVINEMLKWWLIIRYITFTLIVQNYSSPLYTMPSIEGQLCKYHSREQRM